MSCGCPRQSLLCKFLAFTPATYPSGAVCLFCLPLSSVCMGPVCNPSLTGERGVERRQARPSRASVHLRSISPPARVSVAPLEPATATVLPSQSLRTDLVCQFASIPVQVLRRNVSRTVILHFLPLLYCYVINYMLHTYIMIIAGIRCIIFLHSVVVSFLDAWSFSSEMSLGKRDSDFFLRDCVPACEWHQLMAWPR